MAKILPLNGNYLSYASQSTGSNRIVYGATTLIQSNTLDDNITTAYLVGWNNDTTPPPMEWFNACLFTPTQTLAYMFQRLALPWVSGQEKYIGDLSRGSDDKTYICLIGNTTVDPVGDLTSTWELYGLDDFVALTGNQTIAGVKTYSNSPISPIATTDYQVAVKKNVDDAVSDLPLIYSLITLNDTGTIIFEQQGSFFDSITAITGGHYLVNFSNNIVTSDVIGVFVTGGASGGYTTASNLTTSSVEVITENQVGINSATFSLSIHLKRT